MSTVNAPKFLRPALQTNQFMRNGGFYPDARAQTFMNEETNRICLWRTKEVATFSVPIASIPALASTSRPRWRFVIHSSPFARFLWLRCVSAQVAIGSGTGPAGGDPFVKLLVQTVVPATVGTAEFHYGANPTAGATIDTPAFFGEGLIPLNDGTNFVAIPADTDLYCTISDEGSRAVCCTVYETALEPTTLNGYLESGVVAGAPIYDEDRGDMATILRTAWKRGAAHLANWSTDTDATAPTNATSTNKHIIDGSAPPVTAAKPGWTIDLTNRSTVRRAASGVPCIMQVFAKHSVGGATAGVVMLLDSGGGVITSVAGFGTVAGWKSSGAFFMPATVAKYDLFFNNNSIAGTITPYAVSLYQYEA